MAQGYKLQNVVVRVCPYPKNLLGSPLWARGYLAISYGNITDEMIQKYIEEQKGEPVVDDIRFQIDPQ